MAMRYVCPSCGTGRLAPSRMAKDDVRRYCLPCSADSGKLLEVESPARIRAQEKAKQKRLEKEQAKRDRERERLAHVTEAMRVRNQAARLKVWKREGLKMDPRWLEIRDGKVGHGRAGRTGWSVAGRESTAEWNAIVVIHEMVHICLHRLRHVSDWQGHGQSFRGIYLAACVEFFGVDRQAVLERWREVRGFKTGRIKAYDLDSAVYQELMGMEKTKRLYRSDVLKPEAKEAAKARVARRRDMQAEYDLAREYIRQQELDVSQAESRAELWQQDRPMATHVQVDGGAMCSDRLDTYLVGVGTLVTCKRCLAKVAERARAEGYRMVNDQLRKVG